MRNFHLFCWYEMESFIGWFTYWVGIFSRLEGLRLISRVIARLIPAVIPTAENCNFFFVQNVSCSSREAAALSVLPKTEY